MPEMKEMKKLDKQDKQKVLVFIYKHENQTFIAAKKPNSNQAILHYYFGTEYIKSAEFEQTADMPAMDFNEYHIGKDSDILLASDFIKIHNNEFYII